MVQLIFEYNDNDWTLLNNINDKINSIANDLDEIFNSVKTENNDYSKSLSNLEFKEYIKLI